MKQAERLQRKWLGSNYPDTKSSTYALYKQQRVARDVTTDNELDAAEMDSDEGRVIDYSTEVLMQNLLAKRYENINPSIW